MSVISSETVRPLNGPVTDVKAERKMPPRARLDVWSHGVRISLFGAEIRALMIDLCRTAWADYSMVKVGRFKTVRKITRVFVGTNKERTNFHFHRNQLDFVLGKLKQLNVDGDKLEIVYHDLYTPVPAKHPHVDKRDPRDIQLPIIDYLCAPADDHYAPSKVVTLQTGRGKTFLSLYSLRHLGKRTAIVLKGMYVDKWISDIEEAFGKDKGALMVIRGMPQLRAALAMVKAKTFKPRVIIISSKTMFMYLKYFELHGVDDLVPVAPQDLYKHLGVGIRLIDEVHQEFHCNFRQDLYTHIPLTISLSATLEPDSNFLEDMYYINWPKQTWAPEVEYHKFIAVKALWYRFRNLEGIKYLNFMRQYSHTEFEKSILKKNPVLRSYLDMIADIVLKAYIEKREAGQKMMIFVATVQMATLLANELGRRHVNLLVNRYVSQDEYTDLLVADIAVTTLQSAGTAVDIPNLRLTLMTTALSSKQANIQVLGRTRPLKDWPEITPEFYFLSALDVPKHVTYAKEKREKLSGKVLSFLDLRTSYIV